MAAHHTELALELAPSVGTHTTEVSWLAELNDIICMQLGHQICEHCVPVRFFVKVTITLNISVGFKKNSRTWQNEGSPATSRPSLSSLSRRGTHVAFPFFDARRVSLLPTIICPCRARESMTLTRCGSLSAGRESRFVKTEFILNLISSRHPDLEEADLAILVRPNQ